MAKAGRKTARPGVRAVVQRLEDLQRAGITHLPKSRKREGRLAVPGVSPGAPPGDEGDGRVASGTPLQEPLASAAHPTAPCAPANPDPLAALAQLERRVAVCARCAELARTRTQTVFGDGNPKATLVFMGEAPGGDEDRQGKPFVGAAGQKLTQIIVDGMKLRREDVYILNTIKCRPPGNRTPLPPEIANCREYLDAQLAAIQPKYICCLGAVAAQSLLATDVSIGRLRGRVHDRGGVKVVCTYHPAYLLRNPAARADVWEDIKLLMSEMGLKVPRKRD